VAAHSIKAPYSAAACCRLGSRVSQSSQQDTSTVRLQGITGEEEAAVNTVTVVMVSLLS
jgi:hypothetical protein